MRDAWPPAPEAAPGGGAAALALTSSPRRAVPPPCWGLPRGCAGRGINIRCALSPPVVAQLVQSIVTVPNAWRAAFPRLSPSLCAGQAEAKRGLLDVIATTQRGTLADRETRGQIEELQVRVSRRGTPCIDAKLAQKRVASRVLLCLGVWPACCHVCSQIALESFQNDKDIDWESLLEGLWELQYTTALDVVRTHTHTHTHAARQAGRQAGRQVAWAHQVAGLQV